MDFRQHQAIYLQIADYISEKILRGEWQPEQKIFSIRDMAVDVEVNPNTVVRTYDYLEEQSIIYKQRGIGYFVASDAIEKIINLKKKVFFSEDLPELFRAMELLKINFTEVKTLHEKFLAGDKR